MQIFKIEVQDMTITPELVRGLLQKYFSDMQFFGLITVDQLFLEEVPLDDEE